MFDGDARGARRGQLAGECQQTIDDGETGQAHRDLGRCRCGDGGGDGGGGSG